MSAALIFSLMISRAGAQVGTGVIQVSFSLKQNLSAEDLRTTHHGILSLALALQKGQVHRDPKAKTGHLTMRTADLADLEALAGVEFIAGTAAPRRAMDIADYRVRFAQNLRMGQRDYVLAQIQKLERSKIIGHVDYDWPLAFTTRIPLANVWILRDVDGIASVDPLGADVAVSGSCETDVLETL